MALLVDSSRESQNDNRWLIMRFLNLIYYQNVAEICRSAFRRGFNGFVLSSKKHIEQIPSFNGGVLSSLSIYIQISDETKDTNSN